MQKMETSDHNYSELNPDSRSNSHSDDLAKDLTSNADSQNIDSLWNSKEMIGIKIKNIHELKKITPKVKLLPQAASTLSELTKIRFKNQQADLQIPEIIDERAKKELSKYCRTCAGLKIPLVDIFSDKGVQMKLDQQIKHLEDIRERGSLSTQMCMDCICDLKMSYKFFIQIRKAEMKLQIIHHSFNETIFAKKTQSENNHHPADERDKSKETVETLCETDLLSPALHIDLTKDDQVLETIVLDSDTESIEEFDPFEPKSPEAIQNNPPQSDSTSLQTPSDEKTSDKDEPSTKPTISKVLTPDFSSTAKRELNQSIYKYDMALNAYIKINAKNTSNVEIEPVPIMLPDPLPAIPQIAVSNDEKHEISESLKDNNSKQPNILKRKLSTSIKKEMGEEINENSSSPPPSNTPSLQGESKIQKLSLLNPLNITNGQEEGIMYVTVKGSKPNELLLVKVKKMDKPLDKKEERIPSSIDLKPVEKILRKYERHVLKGKELFSDKRADQRELAIEEQIEEYKKKREKVLGNNFVKSKLEVNKSANVNSTVKSQLNPRENVQPLRTVEMESQPDSTIKPSNNDVLEITTSTSENDATEEASHTNANEYLARLEKLKLKWEEAKKKQESLQKELDETCNERNMIKLTRLLGDKETNIREFQEYLKQRKIIITRLKDEDILSLYEDKINGGIKKTVTNLIDESQPIDYVPQECYLECDYCPLTFATKESLEDHIKLHDYKIMHYCEDCTKEFTTNKAKRDHSTGCIKKLICKYCNALLESKGKKRQHEQKHLDNIFGQLCDVCGEKFKHQGTLDQHFKTQHMSWEKIYQCPKCPKKFAFKQKLSFHLKSVHTTMRAFLCEDCGADFKNPASLRHHRIRKHQPIGNKRECQVCHKLVPFYGLSKHMHTHKEYTIQCPNCDKMFKNSSTLKQHIRIHEDQRQFRCDTCGVGFNRRDGLRLHMRVHQKSDSRGLKECSCQVCGEKFPNHSTLVIHRNRVHKDGKQYTCRICNRSMISTRSLEWHMSHIHDQSLPSSMKEEARGVVAESRRVACYHCNKTFKTEMILRTHIKNTHMEKDPMKCLDCDSTFTSEVRLRHHMMVNHDRLDGTLACPHCPKRFVNQLRLKTHMISHSEDRPFTCEICGFNLKTKIQLIKHHQNRHSDERPLQCRYCPWRCKQVSALVCHERTHTNERPYSCSVCRQRFKYLGDKNKHERRHESLGGSGFKRTVPGRNVKNQDRTQDDDTSCSEHDDGKNLDEDEQFGDKLEGEEIIKFEEEEIPDEYEGEYEQDYDDTSREASEAAEVIMNMEDNNVYTEEVTADNMESSEMMTNQILQSGTVVHLQQQDESGKIQVIPVMLSLPDLSDTGTVNLTTASIIYNH